MPAQKEQFQVAKIRVPRRSLSQLKLPQRTDKKHWSSTAKLKASNQSNKLIKQIDSSRSSESKTRELFRSQVIDGAQEEEIDTKQPLGLKHLWQKKHWWQMVSKENTNWPTSPVKLESGNGSQFQSSGCEIIEAWAFTHMQAMAGQNVDTIGSWRATQTLTYGWSCRALEVLGQRTICTDRCLRAN